MDVLGSTGQVELNLFRTQLDEERQTRALASGLRVISASDDPSGLAISENIQTQVLGLQQGIQNVQTAGNLLDVADTTLANVQQILQRIHGLIVEASSDLNSAGDLQDIQTQIDSLLQEVNKISAGAQFNGVTLFNGSLSSFTSNTPTVTEVQSPPFPDGSEPTGTQVVNYNGGNTPGNLVWSDTSGNPNTLPTVNTTNSLTSAFVTIRVTGYSDNAIDPDSGMAVGPGDYVQIAVFSTDPRLGNAQEYTDTAAIAVGSGPISPVQVTSPGPVPTDIINFTLANLSAADVGTSMSFETNAPNTIAPTTGTPLTVNSTGIEGGEVNISLPSLSTAALNLSGISVQSTQVIDINNSVIGTASNVLASSDAQVRVQAALDSISGARATVGAQTVALQEDASDASIQVVNQTASESAIRDLDVGQAVTQFTKDQIMTQIGTSVLAQMHASAQLVIQLVNGMNPGVGGKV